MCIITHHRGPHHEDADEDASQAATEETTAQEGLERLLMFSQDKADAICAALSSGLSLRKAAAANGTTVQSVLRWEEANPAFADQYARARATGYKLMADEIIEISDDASGDVVETDNGPKPNAEFTARSRLRVDSRKWMLSKMLPKIYGDKIETTHEVGDSIRAVVREIVKPGA